MGEAGRRFGKGGSCCMQQLFRSVGCTPLHAEVLQFAHGYMRFFSAEVACTNLAEFACYHIHLFCRVCTWLHARFLQSLHATKCTSFAAFAHSCIKQFCRVCTPLYAPVLAFLFLPLPAAACSSTLVPWFARRCMQRFCGLHMVACTFLFLQRLHAVACADLAGFACHHIHSLCRICT